MLKDRSTAQHQCIHVLCQWVQCSATQMPCGIYGTRCHDERRVSRIELTLGGLHLKLPTAQVHHTVTHTQ